MATMMIVDAGCSPESDMSISDDGQNKSVKFCKINSVFGSEAPSLPLFWRCQ